MIRRALAVGGVAVALLALGAGFAPASAPDGPRLGFFATSRSLLLASIGTTDPAGADLRKIVGERAKIAPFPLVVENLAWAPDGSRLVFSGLGSRGDGLAVVDADGSGLRLIPHTRGGLFPVFSPDGQRIAFVRGRGSAKEQRQAIALRKGFSVHRITEFAIFTISIDGAGLRRLTQWRRTNDVPSSYSPDGTSILVTRTRRRIGDAVAIRTDGSGSTLIERNANFPVYSPDGSRIAFVRTVGRDIRRKGGVRFDKTDLFMSAADGSNPIRLTQSPDQVKLWPSWDPSGNRIAFTQFSYRGGSVMLLLYGIGSKAMEINADGSCLARVLSAPRTGFYGASWQPGLGREAGRIAC